MRGVALKHLIDIHKFRNALSFLVEFESHKILSLGGFAWTGLNSFPHGACFLSSSLLGVYLRELGSDVKLISANLDSDLFPDIKSHAWLEVDGVYVDITSSQFTERTNSRVTVQNKCKAEWLFAYAQEAKLNGKYREQEPDFDNYMSLYNLIVNKVECI